MNELYSNTSNNITQKLTEIYKKYFKDSTITFKSGILGDFNTIFIDCYLAENESELINGYKENDMFHVSFELKDNGNDYSLINLSKCYFIKPLVDYLAYSRVEIPFRKANGNEQKIADSFEKFVVRLKEQLQADIKGNLIHENFIELLNKKIF